MLRKVDREQLLRTEAEDGALTTGTVEVALVKVRLVEVEVPQKFALVLTLIRLQFSPVVVANQVTLLTNTEEKAVSTLMRVVKARVLVL